MSDHPKPIDPSLTFSPPPIQPPADPGLTFFPPPLPSTPTVPEQIGALENSEEDLKLAMWFLGQNRQPGDQAALRVIQRLRQILASSDQKCSNLTAELHEAQRTNTEINSKWAADRAALSRICRENLIDDPTE